MIEISFDKRQLAAKFRPRLAEWGLAFALMMWGLFLSESSDIFSTMPYFAPLNRIAPQRVWAGAAILIGFGRIAMLIVNGGWRPSAGWRALGCCMSCMFWMALCVGSASVAWVSPITGLYVGLYLLDCMSGFFASQDFVNASHGGH